MQHLPAAAGAGLGAAARWAATRGTTGSGALLALVLVNLCGTAVLAALRSHPRLATTTATAEFAGTGFCGGLTTFSGAALLGVGGDETVEPLVGALAFLALIPVSFGVYRSVSTACGQTQQEQP